MGFSWRVSVIRERVSRVGVRVPGGYRTMGGSAFRGGDSDYRCPLPRPRPLLGLILRCFIMPGPVESPRHLCSASMSISSMPTNSGLPRSQARHVSESHSSSNMSPHFGHLVITAALPNSFRLIRSSVELDRCIARHSSESQLLSPHSGHFSHSQARSPHSPQRSGMATIRRAILFAFLVMHARNPATLYRTSHPDIP